MWGVSLTHPMLASFYAGSFSSTSRADFIVIWGASLTHPMLAFFVCVWGVSFFCNLLRNNPLRKELDRSWSRREMWKSHTQTREGSWTELNKTRQELSERWAQEWKRNKRNGSEALNGSEWIRALQTTQKTTILNIKELGGRWPRKRASKSLTQKTERSPTKL